MPKRFLIKLAISVAIIILCTQIGRRLPKLAGLISVMPLTGALVFIWLSIDNPGDFVLMADVAKSALWGIIPSILFFVVVLMCIKKQQPLWIVLCYGFSVWLAAAIVHQLLLRLLSKQ